MPHGALGIIPTEESHGTHAVHQYVTWAFVLGPVLAIALYFRGLGLADLGPPAPACQPRGCLCHSAP